MSVASLVGSLEDAAANIRQFQTDFDKVPALQERVTLAHDWYAVRGPDGGWIFGHSKFVGYQSNTASRYLRIARDTDGGRTEARLRIWFDEVELDTPLGRELWEGLRSFLARRNRVPRRAVRIRVPRAELDKMPAVSGASARAGSLLARVTSDPRICGGRPCIKGTRMRVSDIVDMLAHGAARAEILEDYPYLAEEDVAAALAYAARATDHRVIRAA